jgi:hypothetical protein
MAIVEDARRAPGEDAAGIGEGVVKEIQMGMAVEKSRDQVIASGVVYAVRRYTLCRKISDVENSAVADGHVGLENFSRVDIDDPPVADDGIGLHLSLLSR